MGMVKFLRDYIKDLSTLIEPLTSLTKSTKTFQRNETHTACFNKIKEVIKSSTSLASLTNDGQLILYTDASTVGVGATLAQVQDGKEVHILYLSKKFSEAATKWSTIEQECFGIFYAITQLKEYLLGRHFIVATDHKNLVYLNNSNIPKLVRWRLQLQEFHFTVLHIPGKDNRRPLIPCPDHGGKEIPEDKITFLKSVHNSIIGHQGIKYLTKLVEDMSMHLNWPSYRTDIAEFIKFCPICQKIKHHGEANPPPIRHLQGSYPMDSLSVDAQGPFPEEIFGNRYILSIIYNFSKYFHLHVSQ